MKTAFVSFESRHPASQKATGFYLGRVEWEKLRKFAEEQGFNVKETTPNEQHRVEFCGVRCFKVDAETHFAIA